MLVNHWKCYQRLKQAHKKLKLQVDMKALIAGVLHFECIFLNGLTGVSLDPARLAFVVICPLLSPDQVRGQPIDGEHYTV